MTLEKYEKAIAIKGAIDHVTGVIEKLEKLYKDSLGNRPYAAYVDMYGEANSEWHTLLTLPDVDAILTGLYDYKASLEKIFNDL